VDVMPKRPTSSKISAALPVDYAPLLAEIKSRVQAARIKAGLAANRELLALYWDIGRMISEAQRAKGYGQQVVERLAADLQREFPGLAGFSPLNVWRMRAFYVAYSPSAILSQPVTESSTQPKVPPPAVGAFVRRGQRTDNGSRADLPSEGFALGFPP
jgi:DUF1016 N-terminal domain